jgi:predicted choloylglycine hydrolase
MGMIEFLWGLSDGINDAGLSVALAYGGRAQTGRGFGVTTILRYILETCDTVDGALKVLGRVPSHMAYNLVLADASGRTAGVELSPGGGIRLMPKAIATNHQSGPIPADRPAFTRSFERHAHLTDMRISPRHLKRQFLKRPLFQNRYHEGFGTLFTAEYNPRARTMRLTLSGHKWNHALSAFKEGRRDVDYTQNVGQAAPQPRRTEVASSIDWTRAAQIDWSAVANDYANGCGRAIHTYLPIEKQHQEGAA